MKMIKNFFGYQPHSKSPITTENGLSKSPIPKYFTTEETSKSSLGKEIKNETIKLKQQNNTLIDENMKLKEENSKLREQNIQFKDEKKKYIHLLILTEQEYQKKIKNLQSYVNEMEQKVKYYQSQPEVKLTEINKIIIELENENNKLKNEIQMKNRLMEVNLEREYQCTICKELEKTPGILYQNKIVNFRKSECFFIDQEKIDLKEVVIPKIVFSDDQFKIESRKLTENEIDELNKGIEIVLYNDGSKLTHISAYDVRIKIANESDVSYVGGIMKRNEVKQNKTKTKTQSNEQKKMNKQKESNDESKQKNEIQQNQMKQPIIEQKEIYISIKDAYYGINDYPIELFGNKVTTNIEIGILDGTVYKYSIGQNENGQQMKSELMIKYDTTQYSNYKRDGNNLIAYFEVSKQYEGQFTQLWFFDTQLEQQIQLVDGTFSLKQFGFKGNDGTIGDYIFTIKLV